MAFTNTDLINSDLSKFFQLGSTEAPGKVSFLDIFDDIPTYIQVSGHILYCHMPAQIQSIVFKLPGVASAWVGETDIDLSEDITGQAKHPLNRQYNFDRFGADWDT